MNALTPTDNSIIIGDYIDSVTESSFSFEQDYIVNPERHENHDNSDYRNERFNKLCHLDRFYDALGADGEISTKTTKSRKTPNYYNLVISKI